MDCCSLNKDKDKDKNYDLVIIGSGSAAFAGAIQASEAGKRIAMVEANTIGGTCVNVGCVPSKTLIRAAETKYLAEHPRFKGFKPRPVPVSFEAIIREKDDLVSALRNAKYENVLKTHEKIDFIWGHASFISDHEIQAGEQIIKGDRFLIATGSNPWIPPIPGLKEVDYLTSTTAFELKKLPSSMIVIGGRYIALEIAQMFQRLGTKVTVLQRSNRIFPTEDSDLTEELTKYLSAEGLSILTGVTLHQITKDGVFLTKFERSGKKESISSEQLVIATGRKPNTNGLNLAKIGVKCNSDGSIQTNGHGQTSLSHIYAAGDVTGNPKFVYTAAYGGKLAAHNAFTGNTKNKDYSIIPYVVFTDPQIARVGLNEQEAKDKGIKVDISKLTMDNVPRSLAARDTRGFIKLLKEKGTDQLVGASILAPEGAELLMEISVAMKYKIPVSEIATMFHPYLTLGEGVKLAAQTFNKDVKTLSCCAS